MGWPRNSLPDSSALVDKLPMSSLFHAISHVSSSFWHIWSVLVSPSLVYRQKWHLSSRNVEVDDLVMILIQDASKGNINLAMFLPSMLAVTV